MSDPEYWTVIGYRDGRVKFIDHCVVGLGRQAELHDYFLNERQIYRYTNLDVEQRIASSEYERTEPLDSPGEKA